MSPLLKPAGARVKFRARVWISDTMSNITSCRNSQMFEEEELPVSPEPDAERPPPIGQDRDEPAAAALSQQEEADRSLNKVCR